MAITFNLKSLASLFPTTGLNPLDGGLDRFVAGPMQLYYKAGVPKLFIYDPFGYGVVDISKPSAPNGDYFESLRFKKGDYSTASFNQGQAPHGGDGYSSIPSNAVSDDGQRVAFGVFAGDGPYSVLIGIPDSGSGYTMVGSTIPNNSLVRIQHIGGKYFAYSGNGAGLYVTDITNPGSTSLDVHADWARLAAGTFAPTLHAEKINLPFYSGFFRIIGNKYLVGKTTTVIGGTEYTGNSLQIIDISNPNSTSGSISAGFSVVTTIAITEWGGHDKDNSGQYFAAIDPADPMKLYVLLSFVNKNSGHHTGWGLVSIKNGVKTFLGNISLPRDTGRTYTGGNSAGLINYGGNLYAFIYDRKDQVTGYNPSAYEIYPAAEYLYIYSVGSFNSQSVLTTINFTDENFTSAAEILYQTGADGTLYTYTQTPNSITAFTVSGAAPNPDPTKPSMPVAVTASNVTTSGVVSPTVASVAWTANAVQDHVTGYRVTPRNTSTSISLTPIVVTTPQATITLPTNATYNFDVYATNTAGDSTGVTTNPVTLGNTALPAVGTDHWSTGIEVSATTLTTFTFDPVQIGVSSFSTVDQINLVWNKPSNHGKSDITNYTVYYKKVVDTNYTPIYLQTQLKTLITGLSQGTIYYFHVIAVNNDGEYSPIPVDYPVTTLTPEVISLPEVVELLFIDQVNNADKTAAYEFTWTNNYDPSFVGYNLYISIDNIDTKSGEVIAGDITVSTLYQTTETSYNVTASAVGVRITAYVKVVATRLIKGVITTVESDASNVLTIDAIDDLNSDIRTRVVSGYAFLYDNKENPTSTSKYLLSTRIRKQFNAPTTITSLPLTTEGDIYNPDNTLIATIDETNGFDREYIFATTSYDNKENPWQFVNEVAFSYLPMPDYGIPVAVYLNLNKTAEPIGLAKGTNQCLFEVTAVSRDYVTSIGQPTPLLNKGAYTTLTGNVDRVLATIPLDNSSQSNLNSIPLNIIYENIVPSDTIGQKSILPLKFLLKVNRGTTTQTNIPTGHNNFVIDRKLNVDTGQCGGISAVIKYIAVQEPPNFTLTGYQNTLYLEWDIPANPSLFPKRYEIAGLFYDNTVLNLLGKERQMELPSVENSLIQSYKTRINYVIKTFTYTKDEDPEPKPVYGLSLDKTTAIEPIDQNTYYTLQVRAVYDYRGNEVYSSFTYPLSIQTADVLSETIIRPSITGLDVTWPITVNVSLVFPTKTSNLPTENTNPLLRITYNGEIKEIYWHLLNPYQAYTGTSDQWFAPMLFDLDTTITYINTYIANNYPLLHVAATKEGTQLVLTGTDKGQIYDEIGILPTDLIASIPTTGTDYPQIPFSIAPGALALFGATPTIVLGDILPKLNTPDTPLNSNIFIGKDNIWADWKEPLNNGGAPIYKYLIKVSGSNSYEKAYTVYKDENLISNKHYSFDLKTVGPVVPGVFYTIGIASCNPSKTSLYTNLGPVQISDVLRWQKTGTETYKTLYKTEDAQTAYGNLVDNKPYQYAEEHLTIVPKVTFDATQTQQPIGIYLNNKNIAEGSVVIWYKDDNSNNFLSDKGNGKLIDNGGHKLILPSHVDDCGNIIPDQTVGLIDYEAGIISCALPQLQNSKILIQYRYISPVFDVNRFTWFSTPLFDLEIKTNKLPLTYPHLRYILQNINSLRPIHTTARNFIVK